MVIDCKTGDQLFVRPNAEQTIYLRFTSGGHWDLIKEMTSYCNIRYYCINCNEGYYSKCSGSCYRNKIYVKNYVFQSKDKIFYYSLTRLIATDWCGQNELLSTGFAIIRTQVILVKKYGMNSFY
jgi:hypothetical protein